MTKQCTQCGACCKFVAFPSSKDFEAAGDWLAVRGIKAEDGVLKVEMPCPKLTADGKCSINEHKPKACSDFVPGSIPECPLYAGGKNMNQVKQIVRKRDFKVLSVDEFKTAKKSGVVEATKLLPIQFFKATTREDGSVMISGYANTKGHPDRYGDIPTVFPALRNYVYELTDYLKNPIWLLDHTNSVSSIVGSSDPDLGGFIREDERGLGFAMVFTKSNFGPIAHARTVYLEGIGRAISISGRWHFEDKDNPDHLTFAEIYENSLVAVGADPDALTSKGLSLPGETEKGTARNLQGCIAAYEESIKAGRVLGPEDENALRESREKLNELLTKGEQPKDPYELVCSQIK